MFLSPDVVWHKFWNVGVSAFLFGNEAMFVHPVVVDEFGNVVSNVVWANENASLAFSNVMFFDILHASSKSCTRGSTT